MEANWVVLFLLLAVALIVMVYALLRKPTTATPPARPVPTAPSRSEDVLLEAAERDLVEGLAELRMAGLELAAAQSRHKARQRKNWAKAEDGKDPLV